MMQPEILLNEFMQFAKRRAPAGLERGAMIKHREVRQADRSLVRTETKIATGPRGCGTNRRRWNQARVAPSPKRKCGRWKKKPNRDASRQDSVEKLLLLLDGFRRPNHIPPVADLD
jgi:hypothetical protein